MKLTITPEALDYINQYRQSDDDKLSFVYAHLGCTCSEEGVFSLQLDKTIPHDATDTIESNVGDIHIDPSKEPYLDKEMTLKFDPEYKTLQLYGKFEGLINPRVILVNAKGEQLLKHE